MSDINTSTGSITSPKGFSASATTAGIKPSGKADMALVVNEGPEFHAAAVFTSNKVTAAPVKLSRERVENNTLTAVIYNSGNANACTGAQGERDAADMAEQTARLLGVGASDIAVCSTGLIGDTLPMDKIQGGIDALSKSLSDSVEHGHSAAQAIMTTDTVSKEAIYQGEGWSLAGMGKGVGMMAPSLATMLVCLTTDASVDVSKEMLAQATSTTFDCVDIDGSTSTNDTVILMANGASGVTPPSGEFQKALHAVCDSLARQMQADAEGVTKRVSITVESAHDYDQALQAARIIGRDNLFKCAMFGSDPNWGRVVAAVGMAPVQMDPDHISVSFNGQLVCQDSTGAPGAREVDLTGRDIDVRVNLGTQPEGRGHSATVYTTDLSYQYVEINSEYST